jgi:tRNA (mo5U34)-methyltransferase
VGLNEPAVRAGLPVDCDEPTRQHLRALLMELHPWRKGPFELFGVHIDSEWRSDLKWGRLEGAIAPLSGRLVLDVGCGNGYYGWRMLGAGADLVLGIDPALRYNLQFHAVRRLLGALPFGMLPLALEDLPTGLACFDTVFSMGILYHRRSPLDHLLSLRGCLRPGGELVLETLVIDGGDDRALIPEGRYAQMPNVWFLPSCPALARWLRRCGFRDVALLNCSATTTTEQRSTEWMRFHSLRDFLMPDNPKLTVEGLPAPLRAIFTARSG